MKAERSREANRYRAEGAERSAQIKAEADRERTLPLADAYEEAQKLQGSGEAEAIAIYAQALQQDLEFYASGGGSSPARRSFGRATPWCCRRMATCSPI